MDAVRIFKWSVALQNPEKRLSKIVSSFQRSKDGNGRTFSIQRIVSAQLLALIEELAVYKFLIFSGDIEDAKEALLVSNLADIAAQNLAELITAPAVGIHP